MNNWFYRSIGVFYNVSCITFLDLKYITYHVLSLNISHCALENLRISCISILNTSFTDINHVLLFPNQLLCPSYCLNIVLTFQNNNRNWYGLHIENLSYAVRKIYFTFEHKKKHSRIYVW